MLLIFDKAEWVELGVSSIAYLLSNLGFEFLSNLSELLRILLLTKANDLINILVADLPLDAEDIANTELSQSVGLGCIEGWLILHEDCSLLNHQIVPHKLDLLHFRHPLFHSVFADKFVDLHWPLLTDTIGPVYGLKIILRVPIHIVDDDNIGLD